jgi:hypothetical protein
MRVQAMAKLNDIHVGRETDRIRVGKANYARGGGIWDSPAHGN